MKGGDGDKMGKTMKFLVASDSSFLYQQIENIKSDINVILHDENIKCKMICLEDFKEYGFKQLQMDRIFEQVQFVVFVMDQICTESMLFLLEQLIRHKKENQSSKLEVLLFKRRLLQRVWQDKTIENAQRLVENETEAYLIPYYSFETIKFFFILELHRRLVKDGYDKEISLKNDLIFLGNNVLMSTKDFPEFLLNRELQMCKNQIEQIQNCDNLMKEQIVQLEKLQGKYKDTQIRLLITFQMLTSLIITWQAKELVEQLYEGVYNGHPLGWK